jgi:peptidoglycan/xylan/chitin deacetylase (PgdA/CDA1 family)
LLFRTVCWIACLSVFALLFVSARRVIREVLPIPEKPPYQEINVRAQSARIPVLMYHAIVPERGPNSVWFDCTVQEFEDNMRWLAEQGAQPISLAQFYRHLTLGEPVPEDAVVLTFDDNYQGVYDYAYPILKRYRYPFAVFVHTNYVGDKTGDHPKMDWETLRRMDREGLLTIGSHTLSHPDDMRLLTPEQQEKELAESKQVLERQLGHPIPDLAYPNGKEDATTEQIARKIGYRMAFTIHNGPAEESPNVMAVNRYIQTRFDQAWEECRAQRRLAPGAVVDLPLSPGPVRLEVGRHAGIQMAIARGGLPAALHAPRREGVGEFVRDAGGVAGINGTFFADAALRGTDNTLIGPSRSSNDGVFEPELAADRLPRLVNRPMVVWGPTRIAIFPFQPGHMNAPEPYEDLMPDYTDAFLAGAWIVHNGVARTEEEMQGSAAGDFQDTRCRAFFGVTATGEVALGATLGVADTEQMARAAAEAGIQEAVLLDSGFSTSLIYSNRVVATGHTAPDIPSRPVPHAIVVRGALVPLDAPLRALLAHARPATGPGSILPEDGGRPARRFWHGRRWAARGRGAASSPSR